MTRPYTVTCHGGPLDDTIWHYRQPLPRSLMLFDADTYAYHEYVRAGHTTRYLYGGFAGYLPIPRDLDVEVVCDVMVD